MANLVALGLMVSDKKIFKDFKKISFVAMATKVFEGIKLFQKILKRTIVGTFLWNFIKIQWVVSEKKMFKEKVNRRTDACTQDGQQTMTYARWPTASEAKNNAQFDHLLQWICFQDGARLFRHPVYEQNQEMLAKTKKTPLPIEGEKLVLDKQTRGPWWHKMTKIQTCLRFYQYKYSD